MFRRLHRGERRQPARWVAAATTAVLVTAGVAIASPAHAEPLPINDGFEGNPGARWTVSEIPGLTNVDMAMAGTNEEQNARSPRNFAFLNAYPNSPATATIFRTITPDVTGRSLQAQVYLRRRMNQGETDTGVIVFLRIRNGGPTGRIISVHNTTLGVSPQYFLRSFVAFRPTGTFTVEISAYRGTVLVDDFQIKAV